MSTRQKAILLWHKSPFVDGNRQGRPMAYLVTFEVWDALRLDRTPDMGGCFDAYAQTLYGWPVYIGPAAPPDGILFLPERTVRSMAGIVPA